MKTLKIRMKSEDVAEVLLYDLIGRDPWFGDGIDAKTFREQIKGIKAKTINLRINSPGGSVFDMAAMMAALDEHPARIEVDIDGVAASAAGTIAMTGDRIRMASNSLLMIHNASAGVIGNAADLRGMADLLDKIDGQILDAYERHSEAGRDQLAAWMAAESWFTPAEAIAAGLAHETTEPVKVAAFAGLKEIAAKLGYKKVPQMPVQDGPEWAETRRRAEIAARL